MAFGIDVDWNKPSMSALLAAKVTFVVGYVSPDSSKNLSKSYISDLTKNGIWASLVWESTAGRATQGQSAGAQDAKEALKQAKAVGMPADRPIYFAVDEDISSGSVAAYFKGVASVLGAKNTGVYGSYRVVTGLASGGNVKWFWQTYAWSGGQWYSGNHIEQYSNEQHVGGKSIDFDRSKKPDFGQWKLNVTPTPAPTPTGVALSDVGDGVLALQKDLNKVANSGLLEDGWFGPHTDAALKAFQKAQKVPATGVFDDATQKVMATVLKG